MTQSTKAIKVVHTPTKQEETITKGVPSIFGIIGFALCLTGIGAIIGIPMMIAAYQSNRDLQKPQNVYEAPCPYCGTMLHVPVNAIGSNCPACRKRFLVRFGYFVTID